MSGLIDLVPEYAGSAVEFFSLGRVAATSDVAATNRALAGLAAGLKNLAIGLPAAAQDSNAIVVSAATASRYGLRSVADLARVAPRLVFGGPPECPGRADCLPGLKRLTGSASGVLPLDAGGPLTLQALAAGNVDVALLFSTDPSIPARHLVVLADDRGLQPAENVTPLVRGAAIARYGTGLVAVLNMVSARLDTGSLRALDARVELHGQDPGQVAGAGCAHMADPGVTIR